MKNNKQIFALGFFDGVHLGHQALLKECARLADQLDMQRAAITFDRHPQSLFTKDPPPLINTAADRQRLLRQYGIGTICQLPVVREVMSMPWQDFLKELLESGAAGFVCGHDFRFGDRGQGDAEKLRAFCGERSLPCVIVPEQTVDGIRVSSTHIRGLLEQGQMEEANRFLGHPHLLTGAVIHGHQLGRTLGIPTANLAFPEALAVPRFGVYACKALVAEQWYPAVTNIGVRPTVNGAGITVEPWLLGYDGDLYGHTITLEFYRFLRPEEKFPDLDALRAAIRKDAQTTREYFAGHGSN